MEKTLTKLSSAKQASPDFLMVHYLILFKGSLSGNELSCSSSASSSPLRKSWPNLKCEVVEGGRLFWSGPSFEGEGKIKGRGKESERKRERKEKKRKKWLCNRLSHQEESKDVGWDRRPDGPDDHVFEVTTAGNRGRASCSRDKQDPFFKIPQAGGEGEEKTRIKRKKGSHSVKRKRLSQIVFHQFLVSRNSLSSFGRIFNTS